MDGCGRHVRGALPPRTAATAPGALAVLADQTQCGSTLAPKRSSRLLALATADMDNRQVIIFVYDEPHTIIVHRKHTTQWVAYGMFMDKSLSVEDRTEKDAMQRWREAAESAAATLMPIS